MRRFLATTSALFNLSIVSFAILASSSCYASAFQIWEQSAFGTGDYHSGAAAEADDASLEFYNPAQITELKHQQISTGGVLIPVKINFNGTVNGLDASGKSDILNVVPNFHYVAPITQRLYFAFGLTTPFGLQTNYGSDDAVMASAATKTQLLTLNTNPSLAYKITDWMSVATGFDLLYGLAAYNNLPDVDTPFKNKLTGWGAGYNMGVFFKFNMLHLPYKTQLGASFRSKIRVTASGNSSYTDNQTHVKAQFNLPSTTMFSIYQRVSSRVAFMGSAFYTRWNIFTLLQLENTAVTSEGLDIPVYEEYRNTWNFGLGMHIDITPTFIWKVGGGVDQTPTITGYRDVRLPDVNRVALSTGFHWQLRKQWGVDMGYTHLMTPKANVNNSSSAQASSDVIPDQEGSATMSANVFGGQLSWTFE